MKCEIKTYIKDHVPNYNEQVKLDNLHNKLGMEAVNSGNFKSENGLIKTYKYKLAEAQKYVKRKNQELGHKVLSLQNIDNTYFKLSVNVLPLWNGDFYMGDDALREQEERDSDIIENKASDLFDDLLNRESEEEYNKLFNGQKSISANDILNNIEGEYTESLAKKLQEHLHNNVKVLLLDKNEAQDYLNKYSKGESVNSTLGFYNRNTNEIVIVNTPSGKIQETILHEIIHALTYHYLRNNNILAKEWNKLFKYAKEFAKEEELKNYGFTNADEFLTAVFTNPEFQAILQSKPALKGYKNLWEEIISVLKNMLNKFLGLNNKEKSLLDDVFALGTQIIEDSAKSDENNLNQENNQETLFNKNQDLINELNSIEDREIVKTIDEYLHVFTTHARNVQNKKSYEALLNSVTIKGVNKILGIKNTLKDIKDIQEDANSKEKRIRALIRSIETIDVLSDKMLEDVKEIIKDKTNALDNISVLQSYFNTASDWQILLDKGTQELSEQSSLLSNRIATVEKKLKSIDKYVLKNDESGIVQALKEILIGNWEEVKKQRDEKIQKYEKVLERQIVRKASQSDILRTKANIEKVNKEFNKFDVESDEDIIDFLKGKKGDAAWFTSHVLAYRDSSDPIISGFAKYVSQQKTIAKNKADDFDLSYEKALKAPYEKFGRFDPAEVGKQITFIDQILSSDGVPTEVITLLNAFKNYRLDLGVLSKSLQEKQQAYFKNRTEESKEALINAKNALDQFKMDYMHQEYVSEFYSSYTPLYKDEIGKELKTELDELYRQIREIDNSVDDESELSQLQLDEKENLQMQIAFLGKLTNLDGSEKTGKELEKAKRVKEIKALNRKFYEYITDKTLFENAYEAHKDDLLTKMEEDSQEFKNAMNDWILNNTVIKVKPEAFEKRQRILNQIEAILSRSKVEELKKTQVGKNWEKIFDIISGTRDENGTPEGQLLTEGQQNKVLENEKEIDRIKHLVNTFTGLTEDEQNEYYNLNELAYYGELSDSQTERLNELSKIKSERGLPKSEQEALKKLFGELSEIQTRVPTGYYVEAFNEISGKYGVTINADGQIIEIAEDGTVALIDVLNSEKLQELLSHDDFNEWFYRNHYTTQKYNPKTFQNEDVWQRSYSWSQIIFLNEDDYEHTTLPDGETIKRYPSFKYSKRQIKEQWKTPEIIGDTVDNKGNWLPKKLIDGAKDDKYINKDYYNLVNEASKSEKKKALLQILDTHKEFTLKAQENLGWANKLYLDVPSLHKEKTEKLFDLYSSLSDIREFGKQLYRDVKDKYSQLTNYSTGDINYEADETNISKYDKEYLSVPMKFTNRIDPKNISLDLFHSISQYNLAAEINKTLVKNLPLAKSLQRIVNESNKNLVSYKRNENRENAIQNYLKFHFQGEIANRELKRLPKGLQRPLAAALSTTKSIAAIPSIMLSPSSGIANWVNAKFQTIIKGSNNLFNEKNLAKGQSLFYKFYAEWTKDYMANELGTRSLESQLLRKWSFVQGEDVSKMIGEKLSQSKTKDAISNLSFVTAIRKWGEIEIQTVIGLSALDAVKIEHNGNIISLNDAYELDDKGIIKLKDGVDKTWDFDGKGFLDLKEKIDSLNRKINGSYSGEDRTNLETYAIGSVLLFLKKYFLPMFLNRFSLQKWDVNNGLFTGYVMSNLQIVRNRIRGDIEKWDDLTTQQKIDVWTLAKDVMIIIGALTLMGLMGYSGDDRNKKQKLESYSNAELYILYQIDRLFVEDMGFYSPMSYVDYVFTFQIGNSLAKWWKLIDYTLSGATYKTNTKMHKKGDSKAVGQLKKVTGIQNIQEFGQNPEEVLKSYDQTVRPR